MLLILMILGCCMGSFVHASASRYHNTELTQSRWSICPVCHHRLTWQQMIPVISWISLKGKCGRCSAKIPFHTVLCEVLAGCLYLLAGFYFQGRQMIGALVIVTSLLYAAYCDLMWGLIPDRVHLFVVSGSLLLLDFSELLSCCLFALAMMMVLSFIALLSDGLGFGDVKLISSLAFYFPPYQLLICIAIASCSAALAMLPVFLVKKLKRSTEIPFGPFLAMGAVICLFFPH